MAANCDYAAQLAGNGKPDCAGVEDRKLATRLSESKWLAVSTVARAGCLRSLESTCAATGVKEVVVAPIGFVSDHMEVVYDLDVEAQKVAKEIGMNMVRARTAGTHPAFVKMIRELMLERIDNVVPQNICAPDCCRIS